MYFVKKIISSIYLYFIISLNYNEMLLIIFLRNTCSAIHICNHFKSNFRVAISYIIQYKYSMYAYNGVSSEIHRRGRTIFVFKRCVPTVFLKRFTFKHLKNVSIENVWHRNIFRNIWQRFV